jgi:hypothetical protein
MCVLSQVVVRLIFHTHPLNLSVQTFLHGAPQKLLCLICTSGVGSARSSKLYSRRSVELFHLVVPSELSPATTVASKVVAAQECSDPLRPEHPKTAVLQSPAPSLQVSPLYEGPPPKAS